MHVLHCSVIRGADATCNRPSPLPRTVDDLRRSPSAFSLVSSATSLSLELRHLEPHVQSPSSVPRRLPSLLNLAGYLVPGNLRYECRSSGLRRHEQFRTTAGPMFLTDGDLVHRRATARARRRWRADERPRSHPLPGLTGISSVSTASFSEGQSCRSSVVPIKPAGQYLSSRPSYIECVFVTSTAVLRSSSS